METLLLVSLVGNCLMFLILLIMFIVWLKNRSDDSIVTHVELAKTPTSSNKTVGTAARPNTNYRPNTPTQSQHSAQNLTNYTQRSQSSYSGSTAVSQSTPTSSVFNSSQPSPYTGAAETPYESGEAQDFYTVQNYDYNTDYSHQGEISPQENQGEVAEDFFADPEEISEEPAVEDDNSRDLKIVSRKKPKKTILSETARCNICLGFIKAGLPVITCSCTKKYHVSCSTRVEECPICHANIKDYEDDLAKKAVKESKKNTPEKKEIKGKLPPKQKAVFKENEMALPPPQEPEAVIDRPNETDTPKPEEAKLPEPPVEKKKRTSAKAPESMLQDIFGKYSEDELMEEEEADLDLFDENRMEKLKHLLKKYELDNK